MLIVKKIIYITLIGCFSYVQCSAQTHLTPGEIKGEHDTFVIFKIQPFDTTRLIGIYSKSNKYNNGIPYSKEQKDVHFLPMNPKKDIHVQKDSIKRIIYSVLNNKIAALKKNKESLSMILKFEPNGKLTDMSFTLRENTIITLQDIEELDQQLRSDIKATFTGTQYSKYIAINYDLPTIIF